MLSDLSPLRLSIISIGVVACVLCAVPLSSLIYGRMAGYEYQNYLIVYGVYARDLGYVALSLAGSLTLVAVAVRFIVRVVSPSVGIHGDARLATIREIKKAGLFNVTPSSIIIGCYGWRRRLLAYKDDLHVFLAAPTGAGKGVAFVIPNCLNWSQSLIVVDMKRDAYNLTSGYRKRALRQSVWLFEPLAENTHHFNRLDFVPEGDGRVDSLQKIATTLVPIDHPYFDGQARMLFVGLSLLVLEAGDALSWVKSIGQVRRLLHTEDEITKYLKDSMERATELGVTLSNECKEYIFGFIHEHSEPRGSIRSSLTQHLSLWGNPLVDSATSSSDFDLGTFRKKAQSLYLVAAPRDSKRLGPLFTLLIDSFLDANTRPGERPRDKPKDYPLEVLAIFDEFISLGRVEGVIHGLSYVRDWGIRFATVIQSPQQLTSTYDHAMASFFEDNHRARCLFRPPRNSSTGSAPRDMAEMLGRYTGKTTSSSRSLLKPANLSATSSDSDLYLFTPDQLVNMPDDRAFFSGRWLAPHLRTQGYLFQNGVIQAALARRVVFAAVRSPVFCADGHIIFA